MTNDSIQSRRTFLKVAASIVAAGTATVSGSKKKRAQIRSIHPLIDNLRVVQCTDPNMLLSKPSNWSFSQQNESINNDVVGKCLDAMASKLTGIQSSNTELIWKGIFRSNKPWGSTKVAFKVNTMNPLLMPHIAIIIHIIKQLESFGIQRKNILVYDSGHNAAMETKYSPYFIEGAPLAGVNLLNKSNQNTAYKWNKEHLTHLEEGTPTWHIKEILAYDIIINLAVNKGHSNWNGNATLAMKNHYGTFFPANHSTTSYLFAINRSKLLVGTNPPRQQLCIIDTIFASVQGPESKPSHTLTTLIMGTYAPSVDYLTCIKIREKIMGVAHSPVIDSILPAFGYSQQLANTLDIINVEKTSINSLPMQQSNSSAIQISISVAKAAKKSIMIKGISTTEPFKLELSDLRGRVIFHKVFPSNSTKIYLNHFDLKIGTGKFVISLHQNNQRFSEIVVF